MYYTQHQSLNLWQLFFYPKQNYQIFLQKQDESVKLNIEKGQGREQGTGNSFLEVSKSQSDKTLQFTSET